MLQVQNINEPLEDEPSTPCICCFAAVNRIISKVIRCGPGLDLNWRSQGRPFVEIAVLLSVGPEPLPST